MLANDYQHACMRTVTEEFTLANGGLGLAGECGETVDILKKHLYHGHDLDRDELVKELGDCSWYLAVIAKMCDIDLSEVFEKNIDKLMKRYPEGFSKERSIHRED